MINGNKMHDLKGWQAQGLKNPLIKSWQYTRETVWSFYSVFVVFISFDF